MQENFNSIDKLMAFGMSAAVATQMIQTMNQSIASMRIPGAMPPTGRPEREFYVVVDGAQAGPFTEHEMIRLIDNGRVTADTMAWTQGLTGWMHARNIPEINKMFLLAGI